MAKIISVVSQKGGTGKTITTFNTAAALAKKGYKVLCIDMDAQCNLSTTLGYLPNDNDDTICDALFRICSGKSYDVHQIIHSSDVGVDFVPSSKMLRTLTSQLEQSSDKNNSLNKLFSSLRSEYDYILIDNSAAMDVITANSLYLSDYAIVIVESGLYSFDGLSDITADIEAIRAHSNGSIKVLGIVYNKATNTKISRAIADATEEIFGDLIFQTKIPYRHSMIEQTIELQQPCVNIKRNTLADNYYALADEIVSKTAN